MGQYMVKSIKSVPIFKVQKVFVKEIFLSPFLFNSVDECITIWYAGHRKAGLIDGLVPEFVEDGVAILQSADDTVLLFCT